MAGRQTTSMSRSFVLSLQRSQDLGRLVLPVGQRVTRARTGGWAYACLALGLCLLGFSIISVNTSAAKTFDIRALERQADRLTEQVSVLEAQIAVAQSYAALQDRVRGLGYVPVEKVVYLETGR